jgi:hypothetical protein
VRPSVLRILESMTGTPAFVRNARLDVLAINPLGRALYSPVFEDPARPENLARFCFLDPASRDFYPGWDDVARATVALLRSQAGRDPYPRERTDLVGELATRSEEFRGWWAEHDVRLHQTGTKHFRHPVVGLLDVSFDSMPLPAREDQDLTMTCYTAEPGSSSEDALKLLASWGATATATASPDRDTAAGEHAR